tara:strand:+ start:69 stop:302 length:234 start_codon:yes stop_codon:yes gene_type:complete
VGINKSISLKEKHHTMNQELHEKQKSEGLKIARQIQTGAKVKPLKVLIYRSFIIPHLIELKDRNEFFILLDLANETL